MKAIFITARLGSTRLPEKHLLKIRGEHCIEHVIKRAKVCVGFDRVVLCTTTLEEDNVLCELANKHEISYFRGSVLDKLDRYLEACKRFNIDFFVTMDADDLFCEPRLVELALIQYKKEKYDFLFQEEVSPGAFTHAVKMEALEKVCKIKDSEDTEMMWVYFTDTGLFNVSKLKGIPEKLKRTDFRITMDYPEDYEFFKRVFAKIPYTSQHINLYDVIRCLDNNPEIREINKHLDKEWKALQEEKKQLSLRKDYEKYI